jgi:hypothetical protein
VIKHYFNLQFNLTSRKLKDSGFHPLFAFSFGLAMFLTVSYLLFQASEYAVYFYLLPLIFIFNLLAKKKRNIFLQSVFKTKEYREIRLIENMLLTLPFIVVSLYFKVFLYPVLAFPLLVIFSFFMIDSRNSMSLPTPFLKHPFEFIIGFRKSILLFIGILIICIYGVYVLNYALAAFSIALLLLLVISYIAVLEHVYFVWIYNKTATQFLMYKMKITFLFSFLIVFPFAVIILFYFSTYLWITLGFILLFLIIACLAILVKYSVYPAEINIPEVILIASTVIFPPLLLLTIPYFYSKAKNQLNRLFHDEN